jgi:hypothetical protein
MLRSIKRHETHRGMYRSETSSVIPCYYTRRDPAETRLDVTSSPAHISCCNTIRIPIAQL